ncbi:hypothetical protein LQZ18_06900 [Lachnospiraceae bacterium ZAX-1]
MEYFQKYNKIQLLVHPLSWTSKDADHVQTFCDIAKEKQQEFVDTVKGEWKIFDQLRGKLI